MKTAFDESWMAWIQTNIQRGCDKEGMRQILLEHEFCPELVASQLQLPPLTSPRQQAAPVTVARRTAVTPEAMAERERLSTELTETEDRVCIPNGDVIDTDGKLEMIVLDDFLNAQECIDLVSIIRSNLRKSTLTNDESGSNTYRTSQTCDLGLINDPLIADIDRRLCEVIGIDASYSESIQAQWYDVGQQFKAHTDYFEPNTEEFERHARDRGQRTWTFMIYLNSTRAGGETRFVNVGREFAPKRGRAVIWNSLHPDGRPNVDSMHWGMPVQDGYKVIITKWFRAKGQGPQFTKTPNEYLPAFTREGFLKSQLPTELFARIQDFYLTNRDRAEREAVPGFIDGNGATHQAPSELIQLPQALRADIHSTLQPLVEAWIGHFLEPTHVFGIRRYNRGAALKNHRDRGKTHVASVIINVDQQVDQPWPLTIEDHDYRRHKVLLQPGEMIFYEGARLTHGREEPLDGEQFCNIFVHFKLPEK